MNTEHIQENLAMYRKMLEQEQQNQWAAFRYPNKEHIVGLQKDIQVLEEKLASSNPQQTALFT